MHTSNGFDVVGDKGKTRLIDLLSSVARKLLEKGAQAEGVRERDRDRGREMKSKGGLTVVSLWLMTAPCQTGGGRL